MADLKGRSIASSYKNLLQSSSEISSTNLKQIQSGSGNGLAMKLSTDKAVFTKVGIGNTGSTIDGLLHIMSTSAGTVTASSIADEAVLESSASSGLSILSGTSSSGNLFFGDANDNDVGRISYDHSSDSFSFTTNGSTSMTLDKNSNLRVNGTVSQSDDRYELIEYFEKTPSLGEDDAIVTQSTDATTAVTLDAKYGVITMQAVDLAATDTVEFTFNNAHIYGAKSHVLVDLHDAGTIADNAMVNVLVHDVADGSCKIRLGTNGTDIASQTFILSFIIDPFIIPNQNFVLGGTSSGSVQISGNVKRNADFAGIQLATGTTDNDFTVLTPRDGETEMPSGTDSSAWSAVKFGTENKIDFSCAISTSSSIADMSFWSGLKLTEVGTYATDANQAYFLYASNDDQGTLATNGNLHFVYSVAGTDYITDLGITVTVNTVYRLRISIDENRKISAFVNNIQYGLTSTPTTTSAGGVTETTTTSKSSALTDDIDLVPFIGVQTLTTVAKNLQIGYLKLSRDLYE
tara:strand:- start:135 stop:1688 length:1554 start_codon:yes stop_codon:yes gene_type:complete